MNIIERLKLEGLEVNREYDFFIVEDSEGHIATLDIEDDMVEIMGNDGSVDNHHINQDNMIVYSVLSALDYEFDE